MSINQVSESAEMYLKAIVELNDREVVAIGRLAARLNVTTVSVNEMVKRLNEQGLLRHAPYKGVTLTEKGRSLACDVIRRQRLWECFLHDHLKIEWAKTYEFACALEHATAPEVTEALAEFLDHPKTGPRGNPIPARDGSFTPLDGVALSSVAVGETVRVQAVNATATDVLKYLQERGILPGREIKIIEAAPLHGPLTLLVEGKEVALGLSMAESVIVKSIRSESRKGITGMIQLDQLRPGQRATITGTTGASALRRRFAEMGLVKGETIRMERNAPLGDPVEYFIKGYHLALRKEEAAHIEVILDRGAHG